MIISIGNATVYPATDYHTTVYPANIYHIDPESRCRCGTSLTDIPLVPPGQQLHWRRIIIPLTPSSLVSILQSEEPASTLNELERLLFLPKCCK